MPTVPYFGIEVDDAIEIAENGVDLHLLPLLDEAAYLLFFSASLVVVALRAPAVIMVFDCDIDTLGVSIVGVPNQLEEGMDRLARLRYFFDMISWTWISKVVSSIVPLCAAI